ncbi:MAG: NUDIX hydrolase, partial [Patescibacteria group bacterium]
VWLAVTEDGNILMVREYMQGPDEVSEWNGGGYSNAGERPENTCRRELLAETGYEPRKTVRLGVVHLVPRHSPTYVDLVLATGCRKVGEQKLDATEQIERIEIPLAEWIRRITTGETTDPWAAALLLRALPHLGIRVILRTMLRLIALWAKAR